MIVIAIIGVLAAVSIPAYFNHISRSRQSNGINELMVIRASQEMYFAENGSFADNIGLLQMYASAGTFLGAYHSDAYYRYDVFGNDIRALGDLNNDGNFTDDWRVTIDDLADKPRSVNSGGSEGFSWSSLGNLF